jgi:hypothetical protein
MQMNIIAIRRYMVIFFCQLCCSRNYFGWWATNKKLYSAVESQENACFPANQFKNNGPEDTT